MKSLYFLSLLLLSACSVSTAISGKSPPDFSSVKVGVPLNDINSRIGQPHKVTTIGNGERLYVYKYQKASEPSIKNVVANGLMDISTLGMWELVKPVNATTGHLTLTYDKEDKVASINHYVP